MYIFYYSIRQVFRAVVEKKKKEKRKNGIKKKMHVKTDFKILLL